MKRMSFIFILHWVVQQAYRQHEDHTDHIQGNYDTYIVKEKNINIK